MSLGRGRARRTARAGATRVLVVSKGDGIGGVERQISTLIAAFADRGRECDLVVLADTAGGAGLLAHVGPTVLDSRVRRGPARRLVHLRRLRRIISSGDYCAVLAFGTSANVLVSLAASRKGPPAIVSERGDPFIAGRRRWNRSFMRFYRGADVLVVQSERLASEFQFLRQRPRRVAVIANAVSSAAVAVEPSAPRQQVIVGLARLVPMKRYGDLIRAFAQLGVVADGWRLLLVGDGADRPRLEQLAEDLAIRHRVDFAGQHSMPWTMLASSSIFVLCSQHEGFPNVLLEALAAGCALVAADCRFGPREVITDGESGYLYPVGDVDALAGRLASLIEHPQQRLAMAQASHRRLGEFDADVIAARWLALIDAEVTECSS